MLIVINLDNDSVSLLRCWFMERVGVGLASDFGFFVFWKKYKGRLPAFFAPGRFF
jgi:hypothetical protein